MVDFLDPTVGSLYVDVLDELKTRDERIGKMDFTGDSNVPTDFIRANTLNDDKLERFNGTTWDQLAFQTIIDDHIANAAIHAEIAAGTIVMFGGASAPTGWAFCRGQALSRTTVGNGLELFNVIGIAFGAGDGLTTFNVPDFRRIFPLGKADSGAASTIGATGGTWDHLHTMPNHTHLQPEHAHTIIHTHGIPSHTHNVPGHQHGIPAHHHDTRAAGADIQIANGGAHTHDIRTQINSGEGNNRRSPNAGGGSSPDRSTESANHSHPNTDFTGRVGNVSFGVDGDATFNSNISNNFNTDANTGALATNSQSTNVSTGVVGGPQATDPGGSGNTGTANPPYLTVNFIIKL